jgi:NADPH-dependent curcumin reductase CurA
MKSREIRLASRPGGIPTLDNFIKVIHRETVVKGIDKAVGAFIGLFDGHNIGKMVVELT